MSQAIISGMEREKKKGNMELGRVGEEVEKRGISIEENQIEEFSKIEKFDNSFNETFVEQLPPIDNFLD